MINSREKEVWKPIPRTGGLYEASNYGRIRSTPHNNTKGCILKPYINTRNGYAYVAISINNKSKTTRAHRLVAEAFLGESKMQINHKDGNKINNAIDNLEYCTQSENMKHAYRMGLEVVTWSKKIIDLDSLEVFESETAAAISAGGKKAAMVKRVCDGQRSHYRNRRFARYEDYLNGTIPKFSGKNKKKASESLWR